MLSVAVFALAFICLGVASADASGDTDVLLYEINVYGDDEGVSLHNYGNSDVNLREYVITDNPDKNSREGRITFDKDVILSPGETVTLVKASDKASAFGGRHTTFVSGEGTITFSGSFALNNSKDDVYLFKGDRIVDAFFYGDVEVTDTTLWPDETFDVKKNHFAVRYSPGSGASFWFNYKPGQTYFPFDADQRYDAVVTPFLFPESGGIPIYKALESAKESVCLTMYHLFSDNVCALLRDLAERGVEVTILLEAAPLNAATPVLESDRYRPIVDAGGKILLIGGVSSERYAYVHAKYCIIDDDITIVTSENWTPGNMNGITVTDPAKGAGNRGWGAIIESDDYASFMKNVFLSDCSTSYGDVQDFMDAAPYSGSKTLTYIPPADTIALESFQGKVTPILSPDNSFDALRHYISASSKRVYAEQLDCSTQYMNLGEDSPLGFMNAKANSKVDCKLIMNSDHENDVKRLNNTTLIKAASMSKPYLHNKGIICDDLTLLGSVNWTANSFYNNREVMVAIDSKGATDFFLQAFNKDFERNYDYNGLGVVFTELLDNYLDTGEITVSVHVKQEGSYLYTWELDGKGKTTSDPRTVLGVTVGTHTIKVTVTDSSDDSKTGTVTATFTVSNSNSGFDLQNPYIPVILLVILFLAAIVIKTSSGKGRGRRR